MSMEVCDKFYLFLERIYDKFKFPSSHIWNMEETSLFASSKIESVKVIARRGSKALLTPSPKSREWLTMVVAANAIGERIPSLYIFCGKRENPTTKLIEV